jgi:hypothetical protein
MSIFERNYIMTDKDVEEIYGKSIWDMTTTEIINNNLEEVWVQLIERKYN